MKKGDTRARKTRVGSGISGTVAARVKFIVMLPPLPYQLFSVCNDALVPDASKCGFTIVCAP